MVIVTHKPSYDTRECWWVIETTSTLKSAYRRRGGSHHIQCGSNTSPFAYLQDIKLATKRDATLSRVLNYVNTGWLKEVPNSVQPYVQRQTKLVVEYNCLLWGTRVVFPKSLQDTLLKPLHDQPPRYNFYESFDTYFFLVYWSGQGYSKPREILWKLSNS